MSPIKESINMPFVTLYTKPMKAKEKVSKSGNLRCSISIRAKATRIGVLNERTQNSKENPNLIYNPISTNPTNSSINGYLTEIRVLQ